MTPPLPREAWVLLVVMGILSVAGWTFALLAWPRRDARAPEPAASARLRRLRGERAREGAAGPLAAVRAVVTTLPLLGLLGTITGMVRAFGAIRGAGTVAPEVVGQGLAAALVTTQAGLLLALPLLALSRMLESRAARASTEGTP